jgi:hypothetical protein
MQRVYAFQDVPICLRGDDGGLFSFIDRFTWLSEGHDAGNRSILVDWSEDFASAPDVPPDAETVFETVLKLSNGSERRYSSRRLDDEAWKCIEGYGLIYMDYKKNILRVWRNPTGVFGMDALVILFASPLSNLLANFGFTRLHAACASVLGKGLLITGLSGRGKSTASYALLSAGHFVLTDESAIIRRSADGFECFSLLNTAKIGAGSRNAFFSHLQYEYHESDGEFYTRLPALFPGTPGHVRRIDAELILERTGREETQIVEAGPMEVLPELLPNSLDISSDARMERAFGTVSELMDGTASAKALFGTDMVLFARAVEEYAAKL